MNFIHVPDHDLPTLPDWPTPQLDGLSTPSLTAVALARAHEILLNGIADRSRAVHTHTANLAAFVSAVRHTDANHGFGGR